MYISLGRTVGRPQLGRKGDTRRRGVLEIVFKTPENAHTTWYRFRQIQVWKRAFTEATDGSFG